MGFDKAISILPYDKKRDNITSLYNNTNEFNKLFKDVKIINVYNQKKY